ncbi:OmpH family outer membrane protein [Shimia sp. CNT1-13L.2]|uniref:OmpH family outer membrane protein n=1 Tax=Shimia sp. CNT1-13L.2 TaxID=2959663 RepID=UPI0020CCA293|nr:OmpH family outer membrane protein [Shimia sp. CNT1-13L.2]MCP9482033.1 OmpH family outer membrane protein [Shimia sp. CNT1-13L.2]
MFMSAAVSVSAQTFGAPRATPILTVDSDRMFAESAFGVRVSRDVEAGQSVLLAENRKIEAELEAEEKRLTELRADMEPGEFRAVADAFDERVQGIRVQQDGKARAIAETRDDQRALFFQAAQPVLTELMREMRAEILIERRTVLISSNAIDITDRAIERLNAALGDGRDLLENP